MACLQLMCICTSYIFTLVSASNCYMEHPCISVYLANTKVYFGLQIGKFRRDFRFSQNCCLHLKCGMWHCLLKLAVSPTFQSIAWESVFLDCLTMKMKAVWSFKMLWTAHPLTWYYIPKDVNLQGKFILYH